ncbi:Phosphoglycolate phosphatase, HAD superfamily [Alkalispirochaeta americana]|uniref:phosphoglycolate phosphatase n=1 Tax=Alkalispirochaeta americana TaxID=159291 RepID=A0A1N6WCE8_9SPIO|nr:HAD family hydrolase [Alkalispirochaeta americana]SIQ87754.1 Phosphoglycolate phosphatase, HAD superfamily [Alkalispirochaeta americana]
MTNRDHLIAFDSDGCVFDNMEFKHKACFVPSFIEFFGFQDTPLQAREVWEFVNLYSTTRGINRFKGLKLSLDLARTRCAESGGDPSRELSPPPSIPPSPDLDSWIAGARQLSNASLEAEIRTSGSRELENVLAWSLDVNRRLQEGSPRPFPAAAEAVARAEQRARVCVVSQAPGTTLRRDWDSHGLSPLVEHIFSQEDGTKEEHLRRVLKEHPLPGERVLLAGDAPGDYAAAAAAGVLFFPVIPGAEEPSWEEFLREGLPRFFQGTFAGDYARDLHRRFESALPETPPWERPAQPEGT